MFRVLPVLLSTASWTGRMDPKLSLNRKVEHSESMWGLAQRQGIDPTKAETNCGTLSQLVLKRTLMRIEPQTAEERFIGYV